ncbi:hypothetical protein D3C84_871430 [compost metagenome]
MRRVVERPVEIVVIDLKELFKSKYEFLKCINCMFCWVVVPSIIRIGKGGPAQMVGELRVERFKPALDMWLLIRAVGFAENYVCTQEIHHFGQLLARELIAVIEYVILP